MASEGVQQARLAGVRAAGDDHRQTVAQHPPLAGGLGDGIETRAQRLDAGVERRVGEEVDVLFREVDGGLDPDAQLDEPFDEPVDLRRERALE